jgi:hypothetical protein
MIAELNINKVTRTPLSLVGSIVEVRWTISNPLSKELCEESVYVVRGVESDMICLELLYAQTDGVHNHDMIFWVNILSVQYLRVLGDREAERKIDRLERRALNQLPRD